MASKWFKSIILKLKVSFFNQKRKISDSDNSKIQFLAKKCFFD